MKLKSLNLLLLLLVSCSPSLTLKDTSQATNSPDGDIADTAAASPAPAPQKSSSTTSSSTSQGSLVPPPEFLMIHEVVYDSSGDEADGNTFIELYGTPNAGLSGFSVEIVDGGTQKTTKSIVLKPEHHLNAEGFFVICDARTGMATVSNISNCGLITNFDVQNGPDALKVLNASGIVMDRLCYGFESPLANINQNICEGESALDTPAGMSLSRKAGIDTGDNSADFIVTNIITPGEMGITSADDFSEADVVEVENEASLSSKMSEFNDDEAKQKPKIIISEVVTDPQHDWNDTFEGDGIAFNAIPGTGTIGPSDEWIELKNISNEAVNLTNWSLLFNDGTDESFVFTPQSESVLFSDGGSVEFFDSQESLVVTNPPGDMKNSIDIFLYDDTNELIDEVNIQDGNANGVEDEAIVFDDDGNLTREAASILF